MLFTASVAEAIAEHNQNNQENMSIQGSQLYPAHVQYVEGNDPSIYASTNGQMYELTCTRCGSPMTPCLTLTFDIVMLH